jgi:dTDP-4-amino-4,6-dideoxygalactose transaminase
MKIPFNKPYLAGKETHYLYQAAYSGKLSGNGIYTKKCHKFFEEKYGYKKTLLTSSCTDALEMAAILINIEPEDEVIMPSYTFVSTANAFVLRGAKIIFADSCSYNPNIDVERIEKLITPRTKAIVPVHYAGISVDMDKLLNIAEKHNLYVIEDAAQAIDSYYNGRPLGGLGHFGALSFHDTKNIIAGEGGMLIINDEKFIERAEIVWEKGTNRTAFSRGKVNKYSWVDIGSSFLPSEIMAAFLYAQLESINQIQNLRKKIWNNYFSELKKLQDLGLLHLPYIPKYATNNAHMFYLVCKNEKEKIELLEFLNSRGIEAIFHYLSLYKSPYYLNKYQGEPLQFSDYYESGLIRLPLFCELNDDEAHFIIRSIIEFYNV